MGGMSAAAPTQAFTVASGVLLILLLADPSCRAALGRLPDLRMAVIGLAYLFLLWFLQFTPLTICMAQSPAWARGDMISVDPQWGFRGIIGFGSALAFFLIGALLGADRRRARALSLGLGCLLTVVFIHAVVDYWQVSNAPRDPTSPDVVRLDGAFQSANTLASLWIAGLLGSAGFCLAETPRRGGRGRRLALILSFSVALICFVGLIGSLSRAGIAIGITLLGILSIFAWPERRVLIVLGFASLAGCLAFVDAFGERIGLPVRQVDLLASLLTRLPEWKAALDLTSLRPCLGWGVSSFRLIVETVREAPTQSFTLVSITPHNLLLLITAETGLAGLLAWGVLGVGSVMAASGAFYRTNNMGAIAMALGLAGVFLHNLVDFSFAIPATAAVFSLILGMLVGKAAERPKKAKRVMTG